MTGEISLRGRVMAIGGLKEKTMAALRNGIKTVIIPADNVSDLSEIDQQVRCALHFIPAEHADDVLDIVLLEEEKDDGLMLPSAQSAERHAVRQ